MASYRFSVLALFLSLFLSSAPVAASGIDSENTDLPLNAKGVNVAILRSTGTPGSGVLEVTGLLTAENGAKIGQVAESLCSGAVASDNAGLLRYNTSNNQMQYCNGTAWTSLSITATAAAPAAPASCPKTKVYNSVYAPAGAHGQLFNVTESDGDIRGYQCINGTWTYIGLVYDAPSLCDGC